jgi:hypothetical protein
MLHALAYIIEARNNCKFTIGRTSTSASIFVLLWNADRSTLDRMLFRRRRLESHTDKPCIACTQLDGSGCMSETVRGLSHSGQVVLA